MCSRYTITKTIEELEQRFSIEYEEFYRPRFNAAPSHLLPVIALNSKSKISFFHWGVTPDWAKNRAISAKLYSILRSEIVRKPSFKKALVQHRCLIPADGFYVWKKISKKSEIPYRFIPSGDTIFSIPALYEQYENEKDETITTFSIIIKEANEAVSMFEETMPVIFTKEQESVWLNKESTEDTLFELLQNTNFDSLSYYSVAPAINDIDKDVPSLINPTAPADQHGNYSLFD
jgi:putative SOS response-associated peptidase YedK